MEVAQVFDVAAASISPKKSEASFTDSSSSSMLEVALASRSRLLMLS